MSQSSKTRAQSEAEKSERRMRILAAALELFESREGDLPPMSEVAQRAGIAKGTLYLYFRTQEEIYLALFEDHLHAWIDRLERHFESGPAGAEGFAATLVESGLADRTLLRLAALRPAALEPHVDPAQALLLRRGIDRHLEIAGAGLEKALGGAPAGTGARLLRRSLALLFGLWQELEPPAAVGALHSPEEAAAHREQLAGEASDAVAALWRGSLRAAGI